ncbi:zinc-dependent alcohol dehydrogenase family protein [Ferruginibacter paludis]|uniref:zinc-dependent alcohol dehydrogenase family protein n=1 Tax=Ferruginibacter paludis TaxID=1310417 RepID=UPI0025B5BA5C|nr:zinc-dependent alcohol dehydrogenase family protein [Ferruginibacter paludis]MDN3656589.1 zinc-dependent alcohol dehydrogenase family protein [Ferruginibacter paludis]
MPHSVDKIVIPETMAGMVLERTGQPLVMRTLPVPQPSARQVLAKVIACGVCRTDLHIVDGELTAPKLPLIPGHEIIATVVKTGKEVTRIQNGAIIGIPWLGYTCGTCKYCRNGQENLCEKALFTGYTINGGYAGFTVADERFCFPLSAQYANASGAPLMCAGLIGYRSYTMIGEHATKIGIYGFGAAAHILVQLAKYQHKQVFAVTREGDMDAQKFALKLGAVWAGDSEQSPPEKLDAAIIFAPAGNLVPKALLAVDKGGVVVCGGIHMSDIPSFPYRLLWEERVIRSVANLTRSDGDNFLKMAAQVPIQTETQAYPLHLANEALNDLRNGKIHGAAVLVMDPGH